MKSAKFLFISSLVAIANIGTANAVCFNIDKHQPSKLEGVVTYEIFPGQPNYEDVAKGDVPEPTYLLRLFKPICITGEAVGGNSDMFWAVHLVPDRGIKRKLRSNVNSQVSVYVGEPMNAHTGHHHAPLVAWVKDIKASPVNDDPDIYISQYDTAATSVRAFYYALADGEGAAAASFVVPEKRKSGPLSATRLTAFYGRLNEPLTLIDLRQIGEGQYFVRYRFKTAPAKKCDGRAIVYTTKRNGRNLIAKINALSGC